MVVIFLPAALRNGGLAGAHRLAVEMDGAGAAQASATTELRASHLQMLADDPQKRRITRYIDRMISPIDVQGGHSSSTWRFSRATDSRPSGPWYRRISAPGRDVPPCTVTSAGSVSQCNRERSTTRLSDANKSAELSKTNSKLSLGTRCRSWAALWAAPARQPDRCADPTHSNLARSPIRKPSRTYGCRGGR